MDDANRRLREAWLVIGQRLRVARLEFKTADGRLKKLSQTDLARLLGTSQKQVSLWETGEAELSPQAAAWLGQHNGVAAGEGTHVAPGFSYPKLTFQRLWKESTKRVRHVSMHANVKRIPGNPNFADVDAEITFEGLEVPRGETPLYIDCVGVLARLKKDGSRYSFDARSASELSFRQTTRERAVVTTRPEVQQLVGPAAVGYCLSNVDEDDRVVVRIRGKRGCRADGIDAIGFPIYPDCVVERVSVSVRFVGLKPETRPRAEVWLLRRTIAESRPLDLAGGMGLKVAGEREKYSFSQLLYPKAGFGYCIAWDGLQRTETSIRKKGNDHEE